MPSARSSRTSFPVQLPFQSQSHFQSVNPCSCSYSVSYSLVAVVILLVSVFVLKGPYCVFFFPDSRLCNGMSLLCYYSASRGHRGKMEHGAK